MIVVSAAEANGEFAPTYSHPVLLERTPVRHPDVYSDGLMLTLLDSRPCRAGETTTNNQHTNTHHPSPTPTTKPAPTTEETPTHTTSVVLHTHPDTNTHSIWAVRSSYTTTNTRSQNRPVSGLAAM